MTQAAKSVLFFGYYLLGLGPILMFAPNTLLNLFQMNPTDEVWIRVVGVLTFCLGFYYARNARTENQVFLKSTVSVRTMVLGFFIAFVLVGWVQWQLILFGLVDLAAAGWTWMALKKASA